MKLKWNNNVNSISISGTGGVPKQLVVLAVLHMSGIFFAVFLAVFFAVFLVFLQNRYGTETTVSHVSNTEYRYRTKICYTAMHCCKYLTEFSPCRDHLKVPNRVIEVSGKTCFEANFQFYTVWHCNQNYVHQEDENSVRYSQTIDNQDTKRTSFPDQPFGLGDSWSAGKLRTFQALFSRPAEFGPYIQHNL